MVAEAVATDRITGPNPARKLAKHPEIVRGLTACRERIADLSAMGLRFEPVRPGADYLVTSDNGLASLTAVRIAFLDDVNASA